MKQPKKTKKEKKQQFKDDSFFEHLSKIAKQYGIELKKDVPVLDHPDFYYNPNAKPLSVDKILKNKNK